MARSDSAVLPARAALDPDAPRRPEQPGQPRLRREPQSQAGVSPEVGAVRCLLVDDDPAILSLMSAWLASFDVAVLTARSGPEAQALLARESVHVMVTDLVMDGMDGIELLRRISRTSGRPRVLGISGVAGGASLGEALTALGAEGFLNKPFQREEFLDALQSALGRRLKPR